MKPLHFLEELLLGVIGLIWVVNLLDELIKANDGPAKSARQAELDGLVNWANIANDESDFGASLQLGQDLFNHDLAFAPLAGRTLATAYTLLDRDAFAQIATMHAQSRKT